MSTEKGLEIIFPEDFDSYEWEVEAKGWYSGVIVKLGEDFFKPVFYDPVRLAQEVNDAISAEGFFTERWIIVVEKVCKEIIISTIREFVNSGQSMHEH